jgi:predicted MFS family arabinose efflux permease
VAELAPLTNANAVILNSTTWRGRLLVPVLVGTALLISIISSLGAPLIPSIAAAYGISVSTAQWSLTITLLSGAVTTPIVSRLGDGSHRRAVILGTLTLCTLGSLLAAVPATFPCFLIGRALQGSAMGLIPVGMSVIRDHVPRERRRRAVSTLSVSAAAGVGLGYPLTGLISKGFGFHAGYWLACGLGCLALAAVAFVVPESRHRPSVWIDPVGGVLMVSGLGLLLLAVSQAQRWGWASPAFLGTTAVSAILLAWWVKHELGSTAPVVDLRLMRNPVVLATNLSGLFAGIGMYLLLALVIRYVQTPTSAGYGFGSSVLVAGFILVPFSVLSVASASLVTALMKVLADSWIVPIGCLLFAGALLQFRYASSQLWEVYVVMGLAGLGVGCTFAVMPRLIMRAVPSEQTSGALGVNQVMRFIGFSVGSALSATILEAFGGSTNALPRRFGYDVATLFGAGVWVATAVLSYVLIGRTPATIPSLTPPTLDERLAMTESVDAAASGTMMYEIAEARSQSQQDAPSRPDTDLPKGQCPSGR